LQRLDPEAADRDPLADEFVVDLVHRICGFTLDPLGLLPCADPARPCGFMCSNEFALDLGHDLGALGRRDVEGVTEPGSHRVVGDSPLRLLAFVFEEGVCILSGVELEQRLRQPLRQLAAEGGKVRPFGVTDAVGPRELDHRPQLRNQIRRYVTDGVLQGRP
jgi:hypothetical protein